MSDETLIGGSYLTPRFEHARVSDAMRHGVLTCPREAPLRAAARTMALHHVHCVVVVDPADGRLCGVVSDADLVDALLDPQGVDRTVGEIAGENVPTISSSDPLSAAAALIRNRGISHIVVVDAGSGRPTGMLSTLDLAGLLAWGEA
jgi:CBS domain-containing protein